jgi:hypothetical protein
MNLRKKKSRNQNWSWIRNQGRKPLTEGEGWKTEPVHTPHHLVAPGRRWNSSTPKKNENKRREE